MGKSLPVLRSMTLTVTERCNLRCGYCYMPEARRATMAPEIADASIDCLARHAARDAVSLSFFGGEPFLARETMRRATERAKTTLKTDRLRLVTTTNGLALDERALEWCRASGMELALSIDGGASASERPFAGGASSSPSLWAKVPAILSAAGSALIARMTVTPHNVGDFAANVRVLARAGFARIFWSPAYEMDWSAAAARAYGDAHRAIGEWLAEERRSARQVPELVVWRGIEQRLRGRRKGACGAGVSSVAVATDGRLLACYRLLSEPRGRAHELGEVTRGFTNAAALALFAAASPDDLRPEDGECASCEARAGCTHFCPSLGLAMRDDVGAVPASVCALMRAAVAGVRASLAAPKNRRPAMTWAAAAVAMVAATSSVACGSAGGLCFDGGAGGLCPASNDAAAEADADGGGITFGGICAQDAAIVDDASDAGEGGAVDPGLCPPPAPGLC